MKIVFSDNSVLQVMLVLLIRILSWSNQGWAFGSKQHTTTTHYEPALPNSSTFRHEATRNVDELRKEHHHRHLPHIGPFLQKMPSANYNKHCDKQDFAHIPKKGKECEGDGNLYCAGNGSFDYKMTYRNGGKNVTKDTFKTIYYPFVASPRAVRAGLHYYAYNTPVGYTGFQPEGYNRAQMIFSTFHNGAKLLDPEHCFQGADSSKEGVTCRVHVDNFEYGRLYYIMLKRTGKYRFAGYLLNNEEIITKIGEFELHEPDLSIKDPHEDDGFIETYADNMLESCCGLWRIEALLIAPITDDGDGGFGTFTNVGVYGTTCTEDAGNDFHEFYNVQVRTPEGRNLTTEAVLITRGWKNPDNHFVAGYADSLIHPSKYIYIR